MSKKTKLLLYALAYGVFGMFCESQGYYTYQMVLSVASGLVIAKCTFLEVDNK